MMPLALGEEVGRRDWESRLNEQVRRSGLTSRLGEEIGRGGWVTGKQKLSLQRAEMASNNLLLGKVTKSLALWPSQEGSEKAKLFLKDPNKLRSPKLASKRCFHKAKTSLQEAKMASKGQDCFQG